jgi:pantothenate kinase
MAHYYIIDSTIKNNGKNPVLLFNSIDSVVHHLEAMCQRHFKQDRKTFMNNVESLGFGADEQTGRSFYDQMEQYFNIGVIRKDSTPVKTNIFQAEAFLRDKDVHGN